MMDIYSIISKEGARYSSTKNSLESSSLDFIEIYIKLPIEFLQC